MRHARAAEYETAHRHGSELIVSGDPIVGNLRQRCIGLG